MFKVFLKKRNRKGKFKDFAIRNSSSVRLSIDKKWVISITILSFIISILLSLISQILLSKVHLLASFMLLVLFISVGIFFDVVGLAVASGDEKPFHAMASRKVKGARESIWLLRNAEKVASFCNDVIGDIVGIVSGVIVGVLVVFVATAFPAFDAALVSLTLTGIVAAMTIGGKAIGKTISLNNSNTIIYIVGYAIHFIPFKKGSRL